MADDVAVRDFYEGRVSDFGEPRMRIGGGRPLENITGPDDCEAVPAEVFEAVGFYFVNVLEQDNGNVYVFRADARGTFTYGVVATTDGSHCHLEVYARDGALLAAGVPDHLAGTIEWLDRDAVRRRAAMWG
ncbi:hypothetical protein [Frigoriglobus tundricola]|uniref:Uncharacterized protein n=1 Tax=Frigoriglobus tundricola TaxID=2774151 RepID=A0A6M5Z253_9BACT|nr:hypothetical protein [Frigoriglobus tundricola]QJX00289.1 hypothetical protein FTUN_7914 [Frigoriglobus tundricola]